MPSLLVDSSFSVFRSALPTSSSIPSAAYFGEPAGDAAGEITGDAAGVTLAAGDACGVGVDSGAVDCNTE